MFQEFLLASQALSLLQPLLHADTRTTNTSKTTDLIEEEGYTAETHTVTTDDGYILTIHR